jgi:hypothetical protein
MCSSSTGNYPLVFIMPADPKPICSVALKIGEGTVIGVPDSNRPNLSDFLEVKRR